jgi:acetyltransferase-like isoleucine patch superfamily enzyme
VTEQDSRDLLSEAFDRYEEWMADGAIGRLHLKEPYGSNVCRAVGGRGLARLRTAWRRLSFILATVISVNSWKIFWFRRAGVAIGKNVFITHGVKLDWLVPWLITLEDDVVLGYEAWVGAHIFYQGKLIISRVTIGAGAVVGGRATTFASMGPRSILSPGSVLYTPSPPGATMIGNPAQDACSVGKTQNL